MILSVVLEGSGSLRKVGIFIILYEEKVGERVKGVWRKEDGPGG